MTKSHKEWYSWGYLPHFDHAGLLQMINFRLADSLPSHLLEQLDKTVKQIDDVLRRKRIEAYLDAGHGSCVLGDPRVSRMVEDSLLYFDGKRYRIIAWVIMPNHIHALVEIKQDMLLSEILHSWKSFTANKANRILGKSGFLGGGIF